MTRLSLFCLILGISTLSCAPLQRTHLVSIPELDLSFNSKDIQLSEEAENYISSVVSIMRNEAIHREKLNFDEIYQVIRFYADGAETVEDTHAAIKKALPLLKDHHSYFMTAAEINKFLGFSDDDIEEIKNGRAPHIDKSKIDSLKMSLTYANGKIIGGNVGYLSIPSFNNLYSEGMTLFTDSLQRMIREFDMQKVKGWIIDLRDNDGGSAMPMIAGLGPFLDDDNVYFTVDEKGHILSRSYYKNGGYYDVEADEKNGTPIVQSSTPYTLRALDQPVAVLTAYKTASSAEAVTAVFAGQPNVRIIGSKTNGLTSTNSFNFLEDNSALNITIGYYANRHQKIYKQGITPDIEIGDTTNPIGYGSIEDDPVLQKALLWIKEELPGDQ